MADGTQDGEVKGQPLRKVTSYLTGSHAVDAGIATYKP